MEDSGVGAESDGGDAHALVGQAWEIEERIFFTPNARKLLKRLDSKK
jgi:hypothetical protein